MKSNLVWQTASLAVSLFTQLFLLYYISISFETKEIGYVSILTIIFLVGQLLSEGGLSSYVIFDKEIKNSQITAFKLFNLLVSLLFVFFLLTFSVEINEFYNLKIPTLIFVISGLAILPASLSSISQAIAIKENKLKPVAIAEICQKVSLILILIIFSGYFDNITIYSLSFLISYILRFIILESYVYFKYQIKYKTPDFSILLKAKHYLLNHVFGQGLNVLSTKIDEIIIGKVFSVEVLGGYYIVKQLVTQIYFATSLLFRRLYTKKILTSRKSLRLLRKEISIMYMLYILLNLLLSGTFILFCFLFIDLIQQNVLYFDLSIVVTTVTFVYLKYMSGNLQCYLFHLLGMPLKELRWNFLQIVIVLIPIYLIDFKTIYEYLNVMCFSYLLSFFVSIWYFKKEVAAIGSIIALMSASGIYLITFII